MPASTQNSPELTREQVLAILIQPLQAASVFLASNPRIFDVTAAGVVRIPTLVGMDAPSWIGENTLIPEVDPEFGEVTLLDGVKSLKTLREDLDARREVAGNGDLRHVGEDDVRGSGVPLSVCTRGRGAGQRHDQDVETVPGLQAGSSHTRSQTDRA